MALLEGKVALVTGAGQGVGRCHAEALAAAGAAVVVNDLGESADVVAEAITASGGQARAARGSVVVAEDVDRLVRVARDSFGDLDIVVNNAGFIRDAPVFAMTEEQFEAVVGVHLTGHFLVGRAASAYWRQVAKEAGEDAVLRPRRIINTSSESGLFGGPGQINYASVKGGIMSMTVVQARELGRYNVTANCIAPRARTPMTAGNPKFAKPEEGFDRYDPANVSPMVVWLASEEAHGVSGQTFIVLADQIHRIQPTSIAASISNVGERWTPERITAEAEQLFGGGAAGVPVWGGPPM